MSNLFYPDGYRYGVMFSDGSVAEYWNGSTQKERAQEYADACIAEYPRDNITLCRRLPYKDWERI